jgi:arginine/lysine/ornithine decarboxylase
MGFTQILIVPPAGSSETCLETVMDGVRTGRRHASSVVSRAPLFEALVGYAARATVSLHTPVHRGVAGPPGLEKLLTALGLACDLPSLAETDDWFSPRGCIAEAQHLAAELYHAGQTYFLTNGSTSGVHAMLLAATSPGDTVLLSRSSHVSAYSGLVLSGAVPVYLPTRWHDAAGPLPHTPEEIEEALCRDPSVRAVFLTAPSYYGLSRSLGPIAAICRRHGALLLVDEAHGSHLRFMEPSAPRSAIESGADLVVHNTFKSIGALVGTGLLHRSADSVLSEQRVRAALNVLQTTSTNYLLLASIDLARRWMAESGTALFTKAVTRGAALRSRLDTIRKIKVLSPTLNPEFLEFSADPLRLVIDVSRLGRSGFAVGRALEHRFGIACEMEDTRNVVFVLGHDDSDETYGRLEHALLALAAESSGGSGAEPQIRAVPLAPIVMTPRATASRTSARVSLAAANNRVCAEVLAAYPPGIPLIGPGERFTREIIATLRKIVADGAPMFASDPALREVLVVS